MDPAVIALLGEGLKLLVIGMASVLAFLLVLVGIVSASAAVAARLTPGVTKVVSTIPPGRPPGVGASGQDPRLVAVIAAAIGVYRGRHPH